jgi:hypothetical protein
MVQFLAQNEHLWAAGITCESVAITRSFHATAISATFDAFRHSAKPRSNPATANALLVRKSFGRKSQPADHPTGSSCPPLAYTSDNFRPALPVKPGSRVTSL